MKAIAFAEFKGRVLQLYSPPQRAKKTLKKLDQVLRQVEQLGASATTDITTDLRGWMLRLARTVRDGPGCLLPRRDGQGPWRGGAKGKRPTDQLVAAGIAVGVPGCTFQSLRHTFTTLGRRVWGIDGPAMQEILRHTSIRTHKAPPESEGDSLHQLGSDGPEVEAGAHQSHQRGEPRIGTGPILELAVATAGDA